MKRIAFLIAFLLVFGSVCSGTNTTNNYYTCSSCHIGIESAGKGHKIPCRECHLPDFPKESSELHDHKRILRNPSALPWQKKVCKKCHEKEVKNLESSLHATLAGIVNQTRYLWGAQSSPLFPLYSANGALNRIPSPPFLQNSPAFLVDEFLRRKCVRCHISIPGSKIPGLYRASGCAACHSIYDNDGLYKGNDHAIDKKKHGFPRVHGLTKSIPTEQCLHCHNSNHVGADYAGLFEADYSTTYQGPIHGEKIPVYGMKYHALVPDVHYERGIRCMGCHHKREIMGDGVVRACEYDAVTVRCQDCHGGFGEASFSDHIVPHQVMYHSRLRCSTCHAQWSFQDYGLSVFRSVEARYKQWKNLVFQGDPYLIFFLRKQLQKPFPDPPLSPDWLARKLEPGIWFSGWRFRRWEFMPLGVDQEGRIALLRPQFQYLISSVEKNGEVVLDSVTPMRGDKSGIGWAFNPYSPHTISPEGRNCDSCHQNSIAAGIGVFPGKRGDTVLTIPSRPADPRARLLNRKEKGKLLNPSWHYKELHFRAISQGVR